MDDNLWTSHALLSAMTGEQRIDFIQQILDFARKSFALQFSGLQPALLNQASRRIRERLKSPWTLDDAESLSLPGVLRVEKLARVSDNLETTSIGDRSAFGRYIKGWVNQLGMAKLNAADYLNTVYSLMDLLCQGGWLAARPMRNDANETVNVYQLRVDAIQWQQGDGLTILPDKIKSRFIRDRLEQEPNAYFRHFYRTRFHEMQSIEGSEHTGQIKSNKRKN